MNIFIFDMDGVLLASGGYHRALKETVRLAAKQCGFGEVLLTDEQIARFEALGIGSEWHSSALCMAWMEIQNKANAIDKLDGHDHLHLDELYVEIEAQPFNHAPIKRGMAALARLADKKGIRIESDLDLVEKSESIQSSPTMNWFQEMILGSDLYVRIYKKSAQFDTESYLKLYDEKLLGEHMAGKIIQWDSVQGQGAVIMTSRPSEGPAGFEEEPDARIGVEMVGLERLPLIGNGEIRWLSERTGKSVNELKKPAEAHALAAILAASGWTMEKSLGYTSQFDGHLDKEELMHLEGSTITVFEDTIAGIIAVDDVVGLFRQSGLQVGVRKVGIARDAAKRAALEKMDAQVFPDVNRALESFGL